MVLVVLAVPDLNGVVRPLGLGGLKRSGCLGRILRSSRSAPQPQRLEELKGDIATPVRLGNNTRLGADSATF